MNNIQKTFINWPLLACILFFSVPGLVLGIAAGYYFGAVEADRIQRNELTRPEPQIIRTALCGAEAVPTTIAERRK